MSLALAARFIFSENFHEAFILFIKILRSDPFVLTYLQYNNMKKRMLN